MKHIQDSYIKSVHDSARQVAVRPKRCRKKRWKISIPIFIAIAITVTLILIVLAKFNSDSNVIQGIWTYDQYTQYEFDGQGQGCLQIETERYNYTYRIKKTKLYIDFANEAVRDCAYEFSIQGDVLTMNGEGGTAGGQYTLTKDP